MERLELARLLGAPTGLVTEPRDGVSVIQAAEPTQFTEEFAAAVAAGGTVMLGSAQWGESEWQQVERLRQLAPVTPATAAGKGWLCIPTGGTGGRVKFARHDEDTIAAAVGGFTRHFGLTQVNAAGVLPLHHVSGLMAWLRCALTGGEHWPLDWKAIEGGARPVLPAKPDGWVISLVPTQLERLLRSEEAVAWLRGFRIIFLGGAPAWPGLLATAAARKLPLSLGYGMTETAAMVTALRPEEFLAGTRSSGAALPHATVKIGAGGAIVIGGESLFRGYYPEWRDRWDFETADHGSLDAAGHLLIAGRRDAVIITGGEKVEPTEVEGVLRGTGEFADVVILGVPDAEWGQLVVAAYPDTSSPDFVRLEPWLAGQLPAFKRPKRFVPVAAWPANSQGKVNRAEVARLVGEKLAAELK
jgi:O-succinylbenzoic acid--CoA ligase